MKCENCGNEHDGSYGSGRFCSDSCRRRFCVLKRKTPYKKPVNFGYSKSPFGTWRCSVCNKIFETKALLYDHRHNEHNLYFKRGQWNKGLTKTTDIRLMQQSKKMLGRSSPFKGKPGRKWTAEQKKAMSESRKNYYKQHPEKHPARLLANNRSHMTYAEQLAFDWLTKNKIEFQHHYHFRSIEINRYVDFYIPSKSMFIEIDGEFWHKDRKELDRKKDIDATNNGFITVRIPAKSNIIEKLKEIFFE